MRLNNTPRAPDEAPPTRELVSRPARALGIAIFSCAALFLASLPACARVHSDEEFARNFLVRIKSGDSSIAGDMSPTLAADAGSWQVLDTAMQARMPATTLDSIRFVSLKVGSSLPATERIVRLNVFGGQQYSVAEVTLETAKGGRTLVNTIRVLGPLPTK
jgi:hypothetical protein